MAHPFNDVRQSKVERSRVPAITRGYASGGAVAPVAAVHKHETHMHKGEAKTKFAAGGAVPATRQDRPNRARGGRTKSKGNHVNVIIGSPGGANAAPPPGVAGPMPMPVAPPPRPMMPPPGPGGPPMAGPPGLPPGGPPPGMPIRSAGGRAYASGGAVAPVKSLGTKVQPAPNKNDGKDIGRGRVITYKTGGAVFAKPTGQHAPKFDGGAGGGKARIEKAQRAAKTYKKA